VKNVEFEDTVTPKDQGTAMSNAWGASFEFLEDISSGVIESPGTVLIAENVVEGLESPSSNVRPALDVLDHGGRDDERPILPGQSLREAPW